MTIEPIDSRRVRIALGEEDLRALGLTRADLAQGGGALVPALRALLDRAGEAGFDAAGRRLLVELYPAAGGGCVLYFTGISPPRYRIKGGHSHLFRFADADALIAACRAARPLAQGCRSELYDLSGFVLCVHPAEAFPGGLLRLLGEYARPAGHGDLCEALVREHARLLCAHEAIDRLSAPPSGGAPGGGGAATDP